MVIVSAQGTPLDAEPRLGCNAFQQAPAVVGASNAGLRRQSLAWGNQGCSGEPLKQHHLCMLWMLTVLCAASCSVSCFQKKGLVLRDKSAWSQAANNADDMLKVSWKKPAVHSFLKRKEKVHAVRRVGEASDRPWRPITFCLFWPDQRLLFLMQAVYLVRSNSRPEKTALTDDDDSSSDAAARPHATDDSQDSAVSSTVSSWR